MTASTYPVNLRLDGRRVLIVGAGPIAAGKLRRLLPTGARITVVAPEAVTAIAEEPAVSWHRRPYRRGEVASYRLAVTCTGVADVDAQVFADGEAAGVWVNSADDIANCSVFLPALARRGPIGVAIGTDGTSPALASFLRRRIEADLDDGMLALAELVGETRADLRRAVGTSEHPGWVGALDRGGPDGAPLLELVRAGGHAEARSRLRLALGLDPDPDPDPEPEAEGSAAEPDDPTGPRPSRPRVGAVGDDR